MFWLLHKPFNTRMLKYTSLYKCNPSFLLAVNTLQHNGGKYSHYWFLVHFSGSTFTSNQIVWNSLLLKPPEGWSLLQPGLLLASFCRIKTLLSSWGCGTHSLWRACHENFGPGLKFVWADQNWQPKLFPLPKIVCMHVLRSHCSGGDLWTTHRYWEPHDL